MDNNMFSVLWSLLLWVGRLAAWWFEIVSLVARSGGVEMKEESSEVNGRHVSQSFSQLKVRPSQVSFNIIKN